MKATIFALMFTFTAAGVMSSEADARPNRRGYKKTRSHRSNARSGRTRGVTRRQPTRRVRQPTRRVRKPARRNYRKPARNYRKPARRSYRRPARRHYRTPARRHYRTPVRRTYRPVYRSVVKTITLTNSHGYTIRVAVRAGYSASCMANPVQSRQFLAPGSAVSVSTQGSYVCYRQLPTQYSAGTGWSRAVINARYSRLWF